MDLLMTTRTAIIPNLYLASPPSSSFHSRASLATNSLRPRVGESASSEFSGLKIRPASLTPSFNSGRSGKRGVVTRVIPFRKGNIWDQPPPDLPSYLFKNRIVYLGMPLFPAVTELLFAEFFYLNYEDEQKPIHLYINSTGTAKGGQKFGSESQALSIYDCMRSVKPPIFTLCVGSAWGEAALLLAAGAKGNRSALPSASIMIKQPITRFQGQATDIEIQQREIGHVKKILVGLYARHTGKTAKQIKADIINPKYFSPSEAVEYGIIDKVLYTDKCSEDKGVLQAMKRSNLI